MGVVYKAHDTKLDRPVALKFLPPRLAESDQEKERFIREAKAAATLNHPNICTIYAIEEYEGQLFIAMEFVDGQTLRGKVGTITERQAVDVGMQIADGLAAAHEQGIVHRDIKPENIMVRRDGIAQIMDFGLAKLTGTDPRLTKEGSTVGTAGYMSPEQVQGLDTDHRSDIFSLGVLLYELFAGQRPFQGSHEFAVAYEIVNVDPPPISSVKPGIDPALEAIVLECLEKDLDERSQSVKQVSIDLRRLKRDSGGEGFARTSARAINVRRPSVARPRLAKGVSAIVLLIIATVALLYFYFSKQRGEAIESLAVMPFANTSADSSMEYLSDGITESLINSLSQLSRLKVMSRSSVFRFKGAVSDPQEAGQRLGVRAVLLGRVMQRGDILQVSAELIDVSDNTHLWGEQYNRKSADILMVQDEIAREISQKLRLRLGDKDAERATRRATDNNEAFQLYLKGRYYWNKRSEEDLRRSVMYLDEAVDKDPAYALAYAGLADAYITEGDWGFSPPKECYPKAKAAATKALEIDSSLGEAHTALAYVSYVFDWDWAGAKRRFERAIALNPNYATAHQWYAEYLAMRGRHREAREEIRRARDLDPLSLIINAVSGHIYNWSGQYDSAIEECKRTVEMDSIFYPAHLYLGWAYEHKGDSIRAFAEYELVELLSGSTAKQIDDMKKSFASSGMKGYYHDRLRILEQKAAQRYIPPHRFAEAYAGMGDKDQAFQWLKRSYDERSYQVFFLEAKPAWSGMRSDLRYTAMLRSMGLEK